MLAVLNEAYRVEELENGNSARCWRSAPSRPDQGGGDSREEEPRGNRLPRAGSSSACRSSASAASYEHTGNIGKAYRRHDEVGTPICITVDFDTIEGDGW